MENFEELNEKYHFINPNFKGLGWFSSFNILKSYRSINFVRMDERPPYPIIINSPMTQQVFYNLNKSDFLVFLSVVGAGHLGSLWASRGVYSTNLKFRRTNSLMLCFTTAAMLLAMMCSCYRLTGLMDNGLRWKKQDFYYNKYDLTSHFENQSIFKHFRERP
jgi:hypothetical protein